MSTTATHRFKISKGLDLPIQGRPAQQIHDGPPVTSVAVLGPDHVGMRPTMAVKPGEQVKKGEVLFTDKKTTGVRYTSPGSGTVAAVHRAEKRAFLSVVIELEGDDEETFDAYAKKPVEEQTRNEVRDALVASGLWPSLRTRPYSRVPALNTSPASLFVTAIDTSPLAPDPQVIIDQAKDDFVSGLTAVSKLTDGSTYVCVAAGTSIPAIIPGVIPRGEPAESAEGGPAAGGRPSVKIAEFEGPHPAGLVGTHIHFLDPVGAKKIVWHVGYQDVIAIGRLLTTGRLSTERVVSLAGPLVKEPRLLRTRLGASTADLVEGQLSDGASDSRCISGSILSGHAATGALAYLGCYHQQIAVLEEGRERVFLGWQRPGLGKFSVKGVFLSKLFPSKRFAFTTSTEGSRRAMVPIGMYEKVMPLDIEPTFLLRSLIVDDADQAQALGCLELDEEDLGLCTFVCPGKYEYGPMLRRNLNAIEKFG